MLVDRSDPEDVFARVPEVATQTDAVLNRLDALLEDDQLYRQVRADLGKRYRLTLVHGRQVFGRAPRRALAIGACIPPTPRRFSRRQG